MKRLDSERLKFYLKHRQQLEEWLAVKTDLSVFAHEFYGSLRDDVLNRVPDDVVVSEVNVPPGGSGLFRLRRRHWSQDGPAVELGWWHRARMALSSNDVVWCGLWADEKSPHWQYLSESGGRPGTEDYPEREPSYPDYLMFRYLPHPEGDLCADDQLEAYGESVITALLQAWNDLGPLGDEAVNQRP